MGLGGLGDCLCKGLLFVFHGKGVIPLGKSLVGGRKGSVYGEQFETRPSCRRKQVELIDRYIDTCDLHEEMEELLDAGEE